MVSPTHQNQRKLEGYKFKACQSILLILVIDLFDNYVTTLSLAWEPRFRISLNQYTLIFIHEGETSRTMKHASCNYRKGGLA